MPPPAGHYLFEKLVSGMFLGEVARRILLSLSANHKLLGDYGASMRASRVLAQLAVPGSLTTPHVAAIVGEVRACCVRVCLCVCMTQCVCMLCGGGEVHRSGTHAWGAQAC